ncbi:MAG: hypothetical protein VB041_02130, partial [Candidatus Limiplasma sp.]|nr:hypothetical protein [Candidatus Limiplasma sp.]
SIGRLERLGYVCRERNHRNQRAYVLALTPEGRRQAQTLQAAMQMACKAAACGMSDAELRQFMHTLYRMTDNLRSAAHPAIHAVAK